MTRPLLQFPRRAEGEHPEQRAADGASSRPGSAITHVVSSDVDVSSGTCILLPVANPARAAGLARFAAQLAANCDMQVIVLHLLRPGTQSEAALEPPVSPDGFEAVAIALETLRSANIRAGWMVGIASDEGRAIRDVARRLKAELIILGWRGQAPAPGSRAHAALTEVLTDPNSDIAILDGDPPEEINRVLVPVGPGPHSALALRTAMGLVQPEDGGAPGSVTALHVKADGSVTVTDLQRAQVFVAEFKDDDRLEIRVANGTSTAEGIIAEAADKYDLIVMGTSQEALIDRMLFGEVPERVAQESQLPVVVMRRRTQAAVRAVRGTWFGLSDLLPRPTDTERTAIHADIRDDARPRVDFYVMMGLSAVIASLGLLLNSPAIIIGAMLVAPLMSVIVGVGLGIVEGDGDLLRSALLSSAAGTALAVFLAFLIGLVLPGTAATPEIMSRTAPGVLDLGVALASGAAVAYALCRKDVSAALAGVAIAAALVPPLATVGLGLSMFEPRIAVGAGLLFVTNLIAIAGASALVFLLMGFKPPAGAKQQRFLLQRGALGVILLLTLVTIILAALSARTLFLARLDVAVREAVIEEVTRVPDTVVQDTQYELAADGHVELDVTVNSGHYFTNDEILEIQSAISGRLRRPVVLRMTVIPSTHYDLQAPPDLTPEPAPATR